MSLWMLKTKETLNRIQPHYKVGSIILESQYYKFWPKGTHIIKQWGGGGVPQRPFSKSEVFPFITIIKGEVPTQEIVINATFCMISWEPVH